MVMTLTPTARPYRNLGRRIAALRKAQRAYGPRGMSQRELAAQAGISEGYVPTIEGGTVRPTPEILRKVADALNVSYTELATVAGYVDTAPGEELDPEVVALAREITQLPPPARNMVRDFLHSAGLLVTRAKEADPQAGQQPNHIGGNGQSNHEQTV